jgi:hypothetical protein
MKTASKFVVLTALTAIGGVAQAATVDYIISGGNWDSITQWNNNANGSVGTALYDNGETPACVGCPAIDPSLLWIGAAPPAQPGTYSGTISVDTSTNAVVGGSLVVTGSIADAVVVGTTWWVRQYNNLTIDFAASTASGTATCYGTIFAPVGCGPAVVNAGTVTNQFAPLGGIASQVPDGTGGIAYLGATFDANTGLLQIFRDGRRADATGGTDVLQQFTLQAQVVPVPAAAWLFGSALGLLGVARRKLAA